LIASAPNEEQLKVVVAKYFYCDTSQIILNNDKVFVSGKQKDVVVRKHRGRYRLEHLEKYKVILSIPDSG
jgi:hypothetical protein